MSIKGIRKSFTDEAGATHENGFHVIQRINVNRQARVIDTRMLCYHDETAYDNSLAIVQKHDWQAESVEELTAADFDALIDFVYNAALESDELLQGGEIVNNS